MCIDTATATKYLALKRSAKDRGLDFNLSLQSVKNILQAKRCAYTGEPFGVGHKLSFERVDNTKGYVKGNVVAVGSDLNGRKRDLTLQEMVTILKVASKKNLI